MSESESILDKVIESQNTQSVEMPEEFLCRILSDNLSEREKEILYLRFGLGQKIHTLDAIGKKFFITRERVRQITKQAILKLNKIKGEVEELKHLDKQLRDILERSGGMREYNSMAKEFYKTKASEEQLATLKFFVKHLSDHLEPSHVGSGWQLIGASVDLYKELLNIVSETLDSLGEPHTSDDLYSKLSGHECFSKWRDDFIAHVAKDNDSIDWKQVLDSYLEISGELKKNPFQEWGLKMWASVNPKRISDKIYLVFRRHSKPMHFEEITKLINDYVFDKKKAHAPTVHNELILNNNFVLIGRGIYALKEWGYKTGTVADVLEQILKLSDDPMTREDLLKIVLEQRQVKEGTVYLALNNTKRFKRDQDGRYGLADDENLE